MRSLAILFFLFTVSGSANLLFAQSNGLELSYSFLEATRAGKSTQQIESKLAGLDEGKLAKELNNDTKRKAFWMNVYNGTVQARLTKKPSLFDDRDKFFKTDIITVAGKELSLDDIEHGIIRSSSIKLSMGQASNPFAGGFEKKMRVEEVDPRIHFALNCGAISCPPVAIYKADKLDQQMDKSTSLFLKKNVEYNQAKNEVIVSTLMSWFRGDFGNKPGIIKFLKKYELIPKNSNPSIEFGDYDWTLSTGNYIDL